MEEKLACESILFFRLFFFLHMKRAEKNRCPCMLKKNTSNLIEPRVYELGTIQLEVQYFRTSNRISPGSLVSRPLVKGKKDSWYQAASIPVETTDQSVHKNNL